MTNRAPRAELVSFRQLKQGRRTIFSSQVQMPSTLPCARTRSAAGPPSGGLIR